jgi:hypothetical protein
MNRQKTRRQVAAIAGFIALFLQLCAFLAPASAMAGAGAAPVEGWGLRLCLAGGDAGTQPAKQKTDHLHDQCQICQTLQSLGWANLPHPIDIHLPSDAAAALWVSFDQSAATPFLTAGFSSRAPPAFA